MRLVQDGGVYFHEALEPFLVPIDDVHAADFNYNTGDVEEIKASIAAVGMYRPVIVDADTRDVLAGNHTWQACREMGATRIPVVEVRGMSREQALRLMVSDNGTARRAKPETDALMSLLEEIADSPHGLEGTGYRQSDLDNLQALVEMAEAEEQAAGFGKKSGITLTCEVHPTLYGWFMELTEQAETMDQRFALLARHAGYDASDE